MMKSESRPLFLTKSVKTPSAAGLLHMLPKHTKRTEKGFFVSFVSVGGMEEAIDAAITALEQGDEMGLWRF